MLVGRNLKKYNNLWRKDVLMGVRIQTRLLESMKFEATLPTGHTVIMDSDEKVGGNNEGPRPYHLVAVALAGCTGMDVLSILRKKRQLVTNFFIDIQAEQSEDYPKVYENISIHYHITGRSIDPVAVERSIELSETKYCPVIANLRKDADIQTQYTIYELKE